MDIINPWIEVENFDGVDIMKKIERACRTCYRSEGIISEESYKNLLKNCINRGHESVLEHEKITIRMCCDVGVYKDLTRHRAGTAFSIESTRYCNYSKDKFTNSIKFIDPVFITDENNYACWKETMKLIETYYMAMANNGAKPDELRMMLPHSTAAEVTMTCNIREWKHILSLRCSKMVHPSVRQVMIPLLLKFKEEMPEIFDTVEYDEEFPKEWYAEIKTME
jgi:thymidylate synthase (FAD)